GLILLTLMAWSRLSSRLLDFVLPQSQATRGRRVLIYGAGDAGELLLRELLNNHVLSYAPVGFVDDDPLKKGKVIHGLRVLGGNGHLRQVCEDQKVEEILISSSKIEEARVRQLQRDCEEARITLKRMRIEIELVGHEL